MVQRVRQFFPETWIWQDVYTGADGTAVVPVEAPDSITTWMLRAVGMSKEHGLGIGRDSPDQTTFPGYSSRGDTAKYNPAFQGRQMRSDAA